MLTMSEFRNQIMPDCVNGNLLQDRYNEYFRDYAKAGDGATLNYYTDSKAYTIIKRTAKTLTLQRDKATLNPDFKPDFIPGGFMGTVINQDEQSYTYEPDKNGAVIKAYWSDRKKGFYSDGLYVSAGRHEFYDYNF